MTLRHFAHEAFKAGWQLSAILGVGAVLPVVAVVLLAQLA